MTSTATYRPKAFCLAPCALALCLAVGPAVAAQTGIASELAPQAFADHCFNPFLTEATAQSEMGYAGARIDFYDLRPLSAANLSTVTGRARTPNTDRRCELSFDGSHVAAGIAGVTAGLAQERLNTDFIVPAFFEPQAGASFVEGRVLNPNRAAIVQVGTRQGPNGLETFINVERLIPLDELK